MKDTLIIEEESPKKTSIVLDEIGSKGINQYPLEKDINTGKTTTSTSRVAKRKIKLILIISGIISILVIAGVLSFILFIKKDQKNDDLLPKKDVINMNFSSYKDTVFPLSVDFSDYSGSKGYRISHEALEDLEPKKEEDIFETELLNVTKKTSLERILNTRAGLGANVEFSNSAIGSLGGKISYENIVSKGNKKNYWSVSLLVKRKKVELDRRKIKVIKEVENELLEIIKNDSKYPDKTSKVNKLFKEISEKYGIFVPLEITYGGRFEFTFESETQIDKEINAYSLSLALELLNITPSGEASFTRNETIIEIISKISKSINIIGGNYLVTSFEDLPNWYNSLEINNYGIVSFSGKSYLWDYFSNSTKIIFDEYAEAIEKKLDAFYGKYHLLQGLVDDHPPGLWKDGGDGNKQKEFRDGTCNYDFIIQKALPKVEADNIYGSHCQYKDTLERSTCQIIVGYKLITCNPSGSYDQGGDFELPDGDPILTNKYYFYFSNWPLGTLNCWQLTLCYVDLEEN